MSVLIKEMSLEEMQHAFPLIQHLNPRMEKSDYLRMLENMISNGYKMAGAFDEEKCIGLSGFWINTKLYCDKYVELDNLVIEENYRSAGIGKKLCDWIVKKAKEEGCKMAMLDAYVDNKDSHRFYYREGFSIRGFHFLKKI